jgi:AraC family transcriptional regulator, alkane utilization regulator
MDPLSIVLKSVRFDGALYLNAEFTAPWCVRGKYGRASVRERLAGADHVVFFHFLSEGHCKVRLADGHEVLDVFAGDLILFPQDDRHLIGSDLNFAPLEAENLSSADAAQDMIQIRHGGGGSVTRFVCSYLACSRSMWRPLFGTLPRVLRIPIGDGQASGLVHEVLRVGVRESIASGPGAGPLLAKLAELLFVEALRQYVKDLPPEGRGWFVAVRDPHVGRALALLHQQPNRTWTVEELARETAVSRSALAERFAALVGESPIQYLIRWRLALAARALRSGQDAIARVAASSGYESEASFSRAFKREFGMPPAAWRRVGTS